MGHRYIWQRTEWPDFTWSAEALLEVLGKARQDQGQLLAQAEVIGLEPQSRLLVEETFTTSAIEGENLNRETIRSSVARRLGLKTAGLPPPEKHVDGVVSMLADATEKYELDLTADRLFGWHAGLFPTGYSGHEKIRTGKWRAGTESMKVISGPVGKEKVHFEAPPNSKVAKEMATFLKWWKNPPAGLDGLLRAGVAHFWFVTIHPFEDGNGRIARAITDLALAQDERTGRRLYSLSSQIMKDRSEYYHVLEECQKGNLEITLWLNWFLSTFSRAILNSRTIVDRAFQIARFWRKHAQSELNERQKKVIQKLLEAEPQDFEGGLTNRKYVSMTKASRESAKRDLADLEKKGILKRNSGQGRSVSYSLKG